MDRKPVVLGVFLVLAGVFVLGLSAPTALGQTVTGTIVGTVSDTSGGVIPGVQVAVTNDATKVSYNVVTNADGQYVVPFIPPGEYTITAGHEGFKKQVLSGLTVQVEQRVRADIVLQVGAVTQTVEVASVAPLLSTENSSVGQVVDNRDVVDLPLNGRQFMELAFLTPATHASAPGHFNEILQGFAVTSVGGRPTNNNFTLDGVDNVSPNCGYFSVSPSLDAVQEFKIQTSNYSAEFGRTGGTVINVATKSGTNGLHGSLFEFVRNNALGDSRNFFKPTVDVLRRNDWGGSVGGPVVFPHIYNGKDRTFFFFNAELFEQREPLTSVGRVPTGGILTGDFSQAGYTIYDPATTRLDANGVCCIRDPFPGNVIPTDRLNQTALKALTFYPQPNNPGDPFRNYINSEPFKRDTNQIDARVDHQFSSKDTFFGRYAQSDRTDFTPGAIPNMGETDYQFYGRNVAANWVHTFSPTVVNEFRAGYNRLNFGYVSPRQGTSFSSQLGISGVEGGRLAGFPIFGISGYTGLGDIEPYGNIDNVYQVVDMLSWAKGRHGVKFGIDVRRVQNDYYIARSPDGYYDLSGTYTSDKPGDYAETGFADFLLGVPDYTEINYIGDIGRTRTTNWNAFIQDDWRVTPNLTINLGLRYELYTAPEDKFHRLGFMDPSNGVMTYEKNAPLNNPIPGAGITKADLTFPFTQVSRNKFLFGDDNNFAPRIGFAYKLPFSPKTVIRAGYGVSYVYMPFSDFGAVTQRLLPFAVEPEVTGDFAHATIPGYNFSVGGPRGVVQSGAPAEAEGIDPHFHWGDVQQWSLDVEHQWGNLLLDVGYVGNDAQHLAQRYPTNYPMTPGLGSVQSRVPWANYAYTDDDQSDIDNFYNAGTVRVEKRWSRGLSFMANYTWAKSLGYGSEVYGTPGQESGIQDPLDKRLERGLAPDDVRNRLSISPIWELPFGKGKAFGAGAPAAVKYLIGGWQLNSIMGFQSGFHLSATGGAVTNMGWSTRPDQVCDPNSNFTFSVNEVFNTSCFAKPAPLDPVNLPGLTKFGTAARGTIATHPQAVVDFSIIKNTQIRERVNVQFRVEAFNLLNHPNFATYNSLPYRNFNSSYFGIVTAADDPRLIQLALKLIF
jgi:hypothetical protein